MKIQALSTPMRSDQKPQFLVSQKRVKHLHPNQGIKNVCQKIC